MAITGSTSHGSGTSMFIVSVFDSGIFAKKDLLKAINGVSGDSVYMMNAVIDCLLGKGNGMFITSPETGEVRIVSKNPYCQCPPIKPCCPQRICATVINRACLSFAKYGSSQEVAANE